jgi:hypothetical protein
VEEASVKPDAEGGCLCSAVRYRASGEARHPTLCHCNSCRRASGAPLVAWVTFPIAQFAFTKGAPARYRSSPPVVRTFCASCGTPLTYQHDAYAGAIDVTVASLDDPSSFPPADHTWTSDKIAWLELGDGLPRHLRTRFE